MFISLFMFMFPFKFPFQSPFLSPLLLLLLLLLSPSPFLFLHMPVPVPVPVQLSHCICLLAAHAGTSQKWPGQRESRRRVVVAGRRATCSRPPHPRSEATKSKPEFTTAPYSLAGLPPSFFLLPSFFVELLAIS
ncbi:hypothetical protein BZA05DRAFT_270783 [Tricharina praecox]|uniref:uncharacterized protein n=1 Tax=Tricharina praecox TaxID=43433 RepID=UPI002220E704|nr:uncharacterized protein BZA05DRAFT_270783 [Tricharina praecox]KAI5853828.1 hypothetical protein BZA05DRAFT_270783 [Tricharina praecox]